MASARPAISAMAAKTPYVGRLTGRELEDGDTQEEYYRNSTRQLRYAPLSVCFVLLVGEFVMMLAVDHVNFHGAGKSGELVSSGVRHYGYG